MNFSFKKIRLEQIYPLRISRGLKEDCDNLFVFVEKNGLTGVGEMVPGSLTGCESADEGEKILAEFTPTIRQGASVHEIYHQARTEGIPPCVLAALDMALWDLLAKESRQPLYKLLGLAKPSAPTSVTIGVNPPEVIREQVPEMLSRTGCLNLKVKLGSPQGIDADKESYLAVLKAAEKFHLGIRIDANGGWSLEDAKQMMKWLQTRKTEYVEQPLHHDCDDQLPELFKNRALPIFVDESCRFSSDIPKWADSVDGVNLKLMKCGGITEALRIVATARAFGLQTMIGCMGESLIAISAGAALGHLFDFIDLDSHLNFRNDPAEGAVLTQGIVTPPGRPGHGGRLLNDE